MNAEKVIEKILEVIAELISFAVDMIFVGLPIYFVPRLYKSFQILDEANTCKSAICMLCLVALFGMLISNAYRICRKWYEEQK